MMKSFFMGTTALGWSIIRFGYVKPKGFIAGLTEEQKKAALEYTDEDS